MKAPHYLKAFSGKFSPSHTCRLLLALTILFTSYSARSQCVVNAGNDTAVCLNEPLSLTATVPSGVVVNYTWTLLPAGSGTPVSGSSFTVPTSADGIFSYEVMAEFDDACIARDTIQIEVEPLPTADFTFSPLNECGSTPVLFTNTSLGIGLSYEWDFGDPNSGMFNTSTATNPSHKFIGTPGIATQDFTVRLIVTSSGGCKDTITQQLTTKQSPGLQLGGTGQTIYNGLSYFTTCSNSATADFTFTNQSSTVATNVSYKIIWGDGSPDFTSGSSFMVTQHTYTIGTYTLHFIVNGGAPYFCTDTATYYVFLGSNPAVGLNNPGNTTVCSGSPLTFPITGTFTNPPGTTYTTMFNDGSAPVVFMHPAPAGVSHVFDVSSCGTTSSDGTNSYSNSFSAVIVASNPCGNSSSGVVPIYVSQKPEARFSISPNDTVCTNNTVTFTNTSIGNTAVNGTCLPGRGVWKITPATGWSIASGSLGNDFGLTDPTTWLAGSEILQINFTTPGNYSIRLITGTSSWCSLDDLEQLICVSAVPVAAFDVDQNIGCAPFVVTTTNNTPASFCGNNRYTWTVAYTPTAGCAPGTPGYNYINGTSATSVNPQFEFTNPGVYTITMVATAPGGTCSSLSVSRQVTVKDRPNVTVPALADICENGSVSPSLTATCYTTAATYAWTFPSGTPSSSASQTPGTISFPTAGTYNISVDVTNECGTTTIVRPLNVLEVTPADAGPAQDLCGPSVTMAGNTAVIGTGAWSVVSGPNTPTITNPALPNTTITGLVTGTYVFEWTITNSICSSSSTVTITIVDGPTPANAGPNQELCLATAANLAGNTPTIGTGTWSFVSGPNTPAITDAALANTSVTGLVPGIYTFRWTTTFSNCTPSTDEVQVTIYDNPSVSDAGGNQTICAVSATIAGNTPAIGMGTWSIVSGPNTPSISNPSSPNTTITDLVPGTYIVRWTISNGVCPVSTDEAEIIVTPQPTTAEAGPNQSVCAANSITLAGNTPVDGAGQWSFVSGPNTPNITDAALPNTTVTGLIPGTYVFEWAIASGVCPPSTDQVQIVINNNVTIADAGDDQHLCGTNYTMTANTAVTGTGAWSFISGPNTPAITNPALSNTTITGLIPGTYIFQWTITNGSCASSSNVTIIIADGPTPANAGPDQELCLATSVTLAANTPTLGTGQWTFVSGPGGSAITDASLSNTTVTGLIPGSYTFRWTTTFSNCTPSTDEVQVTVYDNPTVADAGGDQTICLPDVTMTGNTALIGTGAWTIVSGPNTPAITNPALPNTTITGLVPGTYIFRWTITNGVCPPSADDAEVIVNEVPTTAIAGPDQRSCDVTDITLAGNMPVIGAGTWTFVSGPNTPTITDPAIPGSTVTGLIPGTYLFRWTVTNGVCPPSTDEVTVIIDETATTADAGPDQHICGTSATMAGNTPVTGTGTWSFVSGPNTPVISNPALTNTTITGLITGSYVFQWTISNGVCASSSNVTILIADGPTPADAGPDQELCLATSATLTANVPGLGTGQWSFVSGPGGSVFTDPSSAVTTVTGLVPGSYTFRWTTSFSNCTPGTDDVQVTVYDNPTVADAGSDQTICLPNVTMAGNTPTIGTGTWTFVSGPNTPAITSPSLPNTTITGLIPGTYIFRWTIANGVCPASIDEMEVVVTPEPTVSAAGPDQTICNQTSATMAGNTPVIGAGTWTFVSGPNTPVITDASLPNTTITGLVPGTYVFEWTIANGVCPSSTDRVQISNLDDIVNTISSAITTICSGQSVTIAGNSPTGGNGAYTYQWEASTDGGANWSDIAGATAQSLTITPLTTTCYRRKVTSLPCETHSNIICIAVQPPITNNIIAADQTICINTAPATLTGSTPAGGNGAYSYQWQVSTDGGANWSDIPGANNVDYSPGVLSAVTMYRRVVTTDLCAGPQTNTSAPVTISIYQDARAEFTANPLIDCAPFDLGAVININHYPDRNGQYRWYADGVLFGSNTTGIFPGYIMNNQGDTVIIKLVTISQHGCLPDSMEIEFITVTTAFAEFTKTPEEGCGPLSVTFTNTSSILDNAIEYFWDFGNGVTANTMIPPGPIVYNNSPDYRDTTYYITLKAYNGCDTTRFVDSVKVFPDSRARFGVNTTRGCSPFILQITNTSPGNNTAYYWDFGDGTRDTTFTNGLLTHTYNTGAITTYTIRLISENQCTRDTQTIDIVVSPNTILPFVSVFGNQLSGCAPHFVTFSNATVGAAQLTWNFGDGTPVITTPNNQNLITHTFANAGNYTVTITLSNDCSDTTITREVAVFDPPDADFSLSPVRICTGQPVTVTNLSTHANSYEWSWGDGSPLSNSSAPTLSHNYPIAGVYNIRLVATRVHPSGFTCTDTLIRQVTVVDKIPAQINVEPGKFCQPYTLNVNAGNITGFSEIEWVIYDSSTPQGEFHVNALTATHVYDVPGNYSVKLYVRTTGSCVDSALFEFEVFPTPVTTFEGDITTCSHDTTITYTAVTTNTGGLPVNYKWFVNNSIEGTLNPFTYHFQVPLHNTVPVDFTIRALAENAAGCGDTSVTRTLTVQPLPWPNISVSPSLVLQQPDYTFTFKDIEPTNPDKTYTWYMGDRSGQTRDGQEVTYEYGDTGTYNVKLLVTDFSTQCSALDSVQVTILYLPGYLHVPNAMCPGCGTRELREFLPLGKGLKEYRLRIFTTWGQKVFETTSLDANGSPNQPWDGTYQGKPLQQGSYGWTIEAKYINDTEWKGMLYPGSNKPVKAGFITIVR